MENSEILENIVESEEGNEGWVETHYFDPSLLHLNEKISEIPQEVSNIILLIVLIFI